MVEASSREDLTFFRDNMEFSVAAWTLHDSFEREAEEELSRRVDRRTRRWDMDVQFEDIARRNMEDVIDEYRRDLTKLRNTFQEFVRSYGNQSNRRDHAIKNRALTEIHDLAEVPLGVFSTRYDATP